ncbi:MAG: hypothetical protein JSS65_06055 [Armatimonadetes bacterium]|nr:hypothetical protein [Armatimonadota bacterium]
MFSAVTFALCMTQIAAGKVIPAAAPAPIAQPAATASATAASPGADRQFDFEIADFRILQNKDVQKDMGITEDQRKSMNAEADKFNSELKVLDAAYAKAKESDPNAKPPTDKLSTLQNKLKSQILSGLGAAQLTRLREITIQGAGDLALLDPRVGKVIGLSDAQTKSLRSRWDTNSKKAQELTKKGAAIEQAALKPLFEKYKNTKPKDEAEAKARQTEANNALKSHESELKPIQKQIGDLQADFLQLVKSTLDEKQKKAYENLRGKQFKTG